MPVFHVEMRWRCAACQQENLGRHKQCQHCGKPKEREEFYDPPGAGTPAFEDRLTDQALIAQATAGSDWECRYCKSHQRRDSGECASCGALQGESRDHETRWNDGTVGAGGQGPTEAELARQEAGFAPAPPAPVVAAPLAPPPAQPSPWRRRLLIGCGGLSGLVVLLGLGLFWLLRTRQVEAEVVAVHWEHKVEVERYQIKTEEGFDENQPADAFEVVSRGQRHHHDNKVADGTKRVPYSERYACGETCSTTPVRCTTNKNGFKTCSGGDRRCTTKYCNRTAYRTETKYKNVPVYETWYSWKVWRWVPNRTVSESGDDCDTRWPSAVKIALNQGCGPGEKEREKRSSSYMVTFEDANQDKHTYKPRDLAELKSLPVGTHKTLKVSLAGEPEIVAAGQ